MNELVIGVDDLGSITTDVWSSYVGEDAVVLPFAAEKASSGAAVTARVEIDGEVSATVLLACDASSAADLARRLFQLDAADEPAFDDVSDALGELANVVGGNVKSLAPGTSHLTLPEVVAGELDSEALGVALCWLDVIWEGGQASLAVWSSNAGIKSPQLH
jgi:chemotaxis protein CheX